MDKNHRICSTVTRTSSGPFDLILKKKTRLIFAAKMSFSFVSAALLALLKSHTGLISIITSRLSHVVFYVFFSYSRWLLLL